MMIKDQERLLAAAKAVIATYENTAPFTNGEWLLRLELAIENMRDVIKEIELIR